MNEEQIEQMVEDILKRLEEQGILTIRSSGKAAAKQIVEQKVRERLDELDEPVWPAKKNVDRYITDDCAYCGKRCHGAKGDYIHSDTGRMQCYSDHGLSTNAFPKSLT